MYANFIAQDLYSSLQPELFFQDNNFYVANGGKQIQVLSYIYDLFIAIMNPKQEQNEIDNLFDTFDIIVEEYTKDYQATHPESLNMYELLTEGQLPYQTGYAAIESLLNNRYIINIFHMFHESMDIINRSIGESVEDSPHMIHLEAFNKIYVKSNKVYYIQALYEFHNAIAHLYFGLQKSDILNNIPKAVTHLHRGILDNYKNFFLFIPLTSELKEELKSLRVKEFNSIGSPTLENEKQHVIVTYMAIAETMIEEIHTKDSE